jgi:hypothetical protein
MPFNVGDKVRVIPGAAGPVTGQYIGMTLTVERVSDFGNIKLQEIVGGGYYGAHKFELIPQPAVVKVGDWVECIDAADSLTLRIGRQYKVEAVYPSGSYKLEGFGTRYHPSRFKAVPAPKAVAVADEFPFDPALWYPQEGDKVYVVGKCPKNHYPGGMDKYVNDGKLYKVYSVYEPLIYLSHANGDSYSWDKSVLRPEWAGKKAQPKPATLAVPDGPVAPYVPPDVPAEPNSTLREDLFKRIPGGGLCDFAFEGKTGMQDFQTAAPCHAALSRPNVGAEVVAMAYCLRSDVKRYGGADIKAYKRYMDYIFNRSPWAHAFLTKDVNEAMEKDILMNVEVNRFVMAGACLAVRMAHEYSNRPTAFVYFVDKGIGEHAAWVLCCALTVRGNNFSRAGMGGGHDLIDHHRDMAELVKFFQVGYHTAQGTDPNPYRLAHGGYRIADPVAKYTSNALHSLRGWLDANMKATVTGEGWNKKSAITEEAVLTAAATLNKLITGA